MSCFIPRELYGVIGWPLAQSLSPLIHNTGFQTLQIPAAYVAWPLAPAALSGFVEQLQPFQVRGLSVTIPHKQAILPLVGEITQRARLADAVNTVYWQGETLCGDNTDVTGFLAPLLSIPDLLYENLPILLLGAGGAAHAAASGLKLHHCANVWVTSPGNKRQYALAERFACHAIPWGERYDIMPKLIINATPLGMYGHEEDASPYDFTQKKLAAEGWAYDLVYNPLTTCFLRQAAACGWHCISGLEMFFGQGNAQFELWTGQPLPQASRAALEMALGTR